MYSALFDHRTTFPASRCAFAPVGDCVGCLQNGDPALIN